MQKTLSQHEAGAAERREDDGLDDERDPLQEMMVLLDDDGEIQTIDIDRVGRRPQEGGEVIEGIDALLTELQARPPSRMSMLMHRVANSLMALRGLRHTSSDPWTAERVPEEHWRALADEALGLLSDAARRELDEQRLVRSMPESERASFQKLCDSRRGLGVFRKAFEREREAWEQAYWRRALDESFGKAAWTGPTIRRV